MWNLFAVLLNRGVDFTEMLRGNGLEPVLPDEKIFNEVSERLPGSSGSVVLYISQNLDFVGLVDQTNDCK